MSIPGADADADLARGEAPRDTAYGFERTIDEISSHALVAAALAMSLAIGAGAAGSRKHSRRAPTPAAPGAPGQPRQQPTLPSKVDLVLPEPQWAKFCAKEP